VGVESEVAGNCFPEIAVLLATHKPTSVIKEQIDSIYSQELVKVKVYWGDDRSNEETKTYIRSLLAGKNYVEISDTGIGATKNFLHLLRFPTEEYIAFSDQDDIWLPRKLAQHVLLLKNTSDKPALSHSNSLLFIDGQKKTKDSTCGTHGFLELSWQNCVQGCTIVVNSKAQRLMNAMPQKHVLAHDWWAALVVSIAGEIRFNNNTDTVYRIHEGNLIGDPSSLERLFNIFKQKPGMRTKQCLEILNSIDLNEIKSNSQLGSAQDYWGNIFKGYRLKIVVSDKKRRIKRIEDIIRRITLIFRSP
jgi:rhamnosyltransferase